MLEVAEEVVDGEVGVEELGGAGVKVADGFQLQLDLLGGLVGMGGGGVEAALDYLRSVELEGQAVVVVALKLAVAQLEACLFHENFQQLLFKLGVVAQTTLGRGPPRQLHSQLDLLLHAQGAAFDLFEVEVDFVEGLAARAEEVLDLVNDVVGVSLPPVVLSQEEGLLYWAVQLLEPVGLPHHWAQEVIHVLSPFEHLQLRIAEQSCCVGEVEGGWGAGGAEGDGELVDALTQ